MWQGEGGFVLAGVVTLCADSMITVHLHEGNSTGVSWLPLWEIDDEINRRKQSSGEEIAHLTQIMESEPRVIGGITDTFRLEPSTMKSAKAQALL
jgi:hypothetical protein